MLDSNIKRRGRKPGQLVRMTCFACGIETMGRGATKYCRCEPCKESGRRGELPFPKYDRGGGSRAMAAVYAAIREGVLLHPTECKCVDCGAQAHQYDHRDYRRPLDVDPVCRSCNKRRGPAIPLDGSIEARIRAGYAPYSLRSTTEKLFKLMGLPVDALADMPKTLTLDHWLELLPVIQAAAPELEPTKDTAHA